MELTPKIFKLINEFLKNKYMSIIYMSKKCEGCLPSNNDTSLHHNIDMEKDYSDSFLEPDPDVIPDIDSLITVSIEKPEFKNRYLFYFASDDLITIKTKRKMEVKEIEPLDAYGEFDNSGVGKFDSKGKAQISLRNPIEYYVKKDKKKYESHIHYKISNSDNTEWLPQIYTLILDEKNMVN